MRSLSTPNIILLCVLSLLAFAGNSLLCRMALGDGAADGAMDAWSFTGIRLASGALTLLLLAMLKDGRQALGHGNWRAAAALTAYALAFSWAYIHMTTGTGALLLFGAVQLSMMSHAVISGERQGRRQIIGFITASAGMVYLVLPGLSAPPILPAVIMAIAGISWGIYSLLGKGVSNALAASAGNFLRACLLMAAVLAGVFITDRPLAVHGNGILLACCSGAITSGIGYALWYKVLPAIRASSAATLQLAVPVLAALGGMLVLHETLSWRLAISSALVLGGIAWYLRKPKMVNTATST